MTMQITMLTTVMGESGSLLLSGSTYTVSDAFGAAMVGQRKATDTDGALRSTGVGPAMFADSTGQALVRPDGQIQGLSTLRGNNSGGLLDASSWGARTLMVTAVTNTPATTVYWPWVIKTDRLTAPIAAYYIYYSTDHDAGAGGIYMSYGPTPLGPWVSYGQVYVDIAAGSSQSETPSVLWDEYTGNLRLYYQQIGAKYGLADASSAVGQQSTLSATSTDGITWVKDPNFVLDVTALVDVHGDGHTGYFLPFKTRRGLFAYGLYGGGSGPDFVLWQSNGQTSIWKTDQQNLGYSLELMQGAPINGRRSEWNSSFVVESGGVEYWVGRLSDGASGGNSGSHLIGCAPISADYRRLMARPVVIWSTSEAWESADMRSVCPYVENGVLYVNYTIGGTKIGGFSHVL